jgi:putative ABC transport system permease protein
MKLGRNLRVSAKALFAHKLRTALSLLGITLGVATVIVMVAIGEGAEREILTQIESMGRNVLVVRAGEVRRVVGRERQTRSVTTLRLEDAEAILDECAAVREVAPSQERGFRIKYGNLSVAATVMGTTPNYLRIRNYTMGSGRFFTEEENRASLRVAVLGAQVHETLFDGDDAIGEIVRVANIPFVVIGVAEAKGLSAEGYNWDTQVFVPIRTALRRVFQLTYLSSILVQARNEGQMERAEAQIRELLRERHRLNRRRKDDDFTIQSQLQVRRAQEQTARSFTLLISGIAGVSLFVGGVGILAIMLMSVRERTGEIGLRMATGARRRDILLQFLVEALVLGFVGGLGGVAFGVAGAVGAGELTEWQTVVPPQIVLLALGFSLSVGLFFGVYPARRASLLDPIEALRSG